MLNNWFKKEKPFLSGTSTSGGAGGFAVGGGGVSYNPFTLTLDASDRSWQGDPASVVNSWWSSQAATHQGSLISTGSWQYQGYYQATLAAAATVQVTAGGAAGWMNCNGRSIRATFDLAAGTKIVFFAGKATNSYPAGQQQGAGGGASMFAVQPPNPNVLTAHVVAGGGGSGYTTRQDFFCAPGLNTNIPQIISERNAAFNNMNIGTICGGDGGGGLGRGPASSAQGGGAGWNEPSYDIGPSLTITKSTLNTSANGGLGIAYALSQGAQGARHSPSPGGSPGGFGGGGSDWDGNSYGGGGGGYFGGCETAASGSPGNIGPQYGGSPSSEYFVYILGASGGEGNGAQGNYRSLGGQSYINPVATAYSDLGYHGPTVGSSSNSDQTGGQVELQFTF